MLEWMIGFLAVAAVIAVLVAIVLAYFEVIDPFEVIGGLLKLVAGLLFAVGAFFVLLVTLLTRRGRHRKPEGN